MLFNMDLSVIAMIGIVMLVGIVKKNAIMMIDFAIERAESDFRRGGDPRSRAAAFRPIMMTTFAAIFGSLPIALGTGAGAELRQPWVSRSWRLAAFAAFDPLHHAGRVHVSRPHRSAC
jgi:HAE1 family hydrophobic/amphiphilic exporter-1